ncbi:MAG: PqqD family protein [Candidatus Hadarchaeum sp.]|uniref:PqqD family protein n=1 Tax=Candidatus Hadarchaeum sp. TaxID=2883567 RepID=UPI00316FE274
MPFFKKQQPPKVSPERLYRSTPVVTPGIQYEEDSKGIITLLIPIKEDDKVIRTMKIKLDAIGSKVWKKIDGKTSFNEICQWMKSEFLITEKEAEVSLSMFIKSLADKRLVALVLPPPKPGTEEVQEELERLKFEIRELEKAYRKRRIDEKTYMEAKASYEEAIKELEKLEKPGN